MTDPQQIRIGHAERDRAVETLREAAADGRLTLAELDERLEKALVARTRGDLHALLTDLVPPGQIALVVSPALVRAQETGPGWTWQDPLVLTARWDDVLRAGPWEVPPFLEVNPVASNVKLDFVDARTQAHLIDVNMLGGAGDLVLVVPEGWAVDLSRIDKGLGSIKTTGVPTSPRPGFPLIIVRGKTSLGDIKVRTPNWWDVRQRNKRLAKGGGIVAKN
ncbi:MAG: DUF1707 domain-containing protein [Propioniciclava sp.]|uniref:DUF1707 SHOCT-like domain-containing protein n=1 Tax=Propioniciclava sp. TaxID=2038686 RepID=UPI0039E3B77A